MKFQLHKKIRKKHFSMSMLALFLSLVVVLVALPASTRAATNPISPSKGNVNSPSNIKTSFPLSQAIAMMNEQEGWAELGFLKHTSDGGKTWQLIEQPHEDQAFVGTPYVFDAQTAWYSTEKGFTIDAFYRTNDGGKSWTRFPASLPMIALNTLSIIDNQHAWVVVDDKNGPHLFLIGADGQNWQEATIPVPDGILNVGSLHFISQQVGWMVISTVRSGSEFLPFPEDLYMTRDGGHSWTKQHIVRPKGVTDSSLMYIQLLGFTDERIGILKVTFIDPQDQSFKNLVYIYRSLNGGHSWHIHSDAQPDPFHLIVQIDTWNIITPSTVAGVVEDNPHLALATFRFGKWETQNLALPQSGLTDFFVSRFSSNLMFMSAHTHTFFGIPVGLFKSTDDGQSWEEIIDLPDIP